MMRKSLALVLAVLSFVAVWPRSEPRPDHVEPIVVMHGYPTGWGRGGGPLELRGLWRLTSEQESFGGFSALTVMEGGGLRLFSDNGTVLELPLPTEGNRRLRRPLRRIGEDTARKSGRDIEAATNWGRQTWLALENRNAILRLGPELQIERSTAPRSLADWPANGGPEAMTRLADGRFLVLREGRPVFGDTDPIQAVLFAADPTTDAPARQITITGADGYHPVDAATAPDGRVLVLLRRLGFGWPIEFRSRIAWLDPRDLEDGKARLSAPIALERLLPQDNYEGIAVRADGERWDVWVVSDDNDSFFQASWLARLSLDPAALLGRVQKAQ